MFVKAVRKQSRMRIAICGPSGCGKTYSALLVAFGLAGGGRVAMIDTEHGSGELYSDLGDYDVARIDAPYTPERFIGAITEAERQGYSVLVIDSLSHEWAGIGGVLETHDSVVNAQRVKNSFTAWSEVTPRHNRLVEKILACGCHVIATMRSKTAYEMQEGDDHNGKKKKTIKRIGTTPVQREGMEYEFGIMFEQDQDTHLAVPIKNRTPLFQDGPALLSRDDGSAIHQWIATAAEISIDMRETYAKAAEFLDLPGAVIEDEARQAIAAQRDGEIPASVQSLAEPLAVIVRAHLRALGKAKAQPESKPAKTLAQRRQAEINAKIQESGVDREQVKAGLKKLFGVESTAKCDGLDADTWKDIVADLATIAKSATEDKADG